MSSKNKPYQVKKIPYYTMHLFLTIGASCILGFLSFGGIYILFPILPLAFVAFGLSVAYEGEIYVQNVTSSLKKLFKQNHLKNYLAREYLLTTIANTLKTQDCPEFFKDYADELKRLGEFSHKKLNAKSAERKRQIEKTLTDMEKWFALQLFPAQGATQSKYAKNLTTWLVRNNQADWQIRYNNRRTLFHGIKIFSALSAVFMALGTSYLMVEAFSIIPFFVGISFAFWPIIIAPAAVIAGIAYGLLTYNAVTDMVNNDTINKWYKKLRAEWDNGRQNGFTARNILMLTTAAFLITITLTLTICTAGTWWTVASKARPLFAWMGRMPMAIMGIINPIITGISALCFNFQNSAETLELIYNAKKEDFINMWKSIRRAYKEVIKNENTFQLFNPFRIILKLTILPLRILFFIGHLVSIGVTADRMPGFSSILAALIAMFSEGFEDFGYFFDIGHSNCHAHASETQEHHEHPYHGHSHSCHEHSHSDHGHSEHEHQNEEEKAHTHNDLDSLLKERLSPAHSHSHDIDLPTRLIVGIATPVYRLAAAWDYYFSQRNDGITRPKLSKERALDKQYGIKEGVEVKLNSDDKGPSKEWKVEHTVTLIEKYKAKHLQGAVFAPELADKKIAALNELKERVVASDTNQPLERVLSSETTDMSKKDVYNKHRMFQLSETTSTQAFIEQLPRRVNCASA